MLDWLYSLFVSFFTYVSSFFMSLFSSAKTVEEGQEQEQEVALDRPVQTGGTNQMLEGGNFQSVQSVQPVELREE
jgi:hypothetical protein